MAVFRNDDAHPGTQSGGRVEEDVKVLRPLPLPPLKQALDLGTESYPCLTRKPLGWARALDGYFPPVCTTSCARPRLRRRFNVLRPPTVFMRERNPCLFTRLRLRGLYVGFIPASPIHDVTTFRDKLGKIAVRRQTGQRPVWFGAQKVLKTHV